MRIALKIAWDSSSLIVHDEVKERPLSQTHGQHRKGQEKDLQP